MIQFFIRGKSNNKKDNYANSVDKMLVKWLLPENVSRKERKEIKNAKAAEKAALRPLRKSLRSLRETLVLK